MADQTDALSIYEPYSLAAAQEELKKIEAGSTKYAKFAMGRNRGRIPPALRGSGGVFLKVEQHWVPMPGGAKNEGRSFFCARRMANLPCKVCDRVSKLGNTGAAGDAELAKQMKAKDSYLTNWISRAEQDKGPQVMRLPWGVYKKFVDFRTDPDMAVDYTDPLKGNDLIVIKTDEGPYHAKYDAKLGPQCEIGSPEKSAEWIKSQTNLKSLVIFSTPEEIDAALDGDASAFPPREAKEVNGSASPAITPQSEDIAY